MNKVTVRSMESPERPLSELYTGTLVRWEDGYYIVAASSMQSKGFGAVNLSKGTYLSPSTLVTVLPEGTLVEVVAGDPND